MFRIEAERFDGVRFFFGGNSTPKEWRYPEDADAVAEQHWMKYSNTEQYVRFSVIEQDGTVYSDWEV